MPLGIDDLVNEISPESTVLIFGAGSSIPSGSPPTRTIAAALGKLIGVESDGYTLSEIAELAETLQGRRPIIDKCRSLFPRPNPTGGLLNLPLYPWKNIYTTNFDELIEESYKRKNIILPRYVSNFDFTIRGTQDQTRLYKLHGTISEDVSTGDKARLILTESDYNQVEEYRELLFDTLKGDLANSNLIIIGHSLADDDIRAIVNRASLLAKKAMTAPSIYLLMYQTDVHRARLYEQKNIKVCFGGIDEFFAGLSQAPKIARRDYELSTVSELPTALAPTTLAVKHAIELESNIERMFNGWSASYSDINQGLTFKRSLTDRLQTQFLRNEKWIAVTLGVSGVGKTTCARQVLVELNRKGFHCWEHRDDFLLNPQEWRSVGTSLKASDSRGILLIDNAHDHLYQLNDLIDLLAADDCDSLKLILISAKNNWNARVKTPSLFRASESYELSKLDNAEIEALLDLVYSHPLIQRMVERSFSGFSRQEQSRRLRIRCDADMFVCLKNIFASEKFDDIILREFADLDQSAQDVYRAVAAMESAGVRVHRQLIIRMLGVAPTSIRALLESLADIINEYSIDERNGIYGWKGRHHVITDIITRHKYSDPKAYEALISKVIDNLVPSYEIEIRTIRELCAIDGLSKLADKTAQNVILKKMISKVPGERVPRHRLIRNLIDIGQFENAETEVRVFESDFGVDSPVHRYKVQLLLARATQTPGLMKEDRIAILDKALTLVRAGASRYPANPAMLRTYGEVGLEIYKRTKSTEAFDDALREMKEAEKEISDPEITRIIKMFERRVAGYDLADSDTETAP